MRLTTIFAAGLSALVLSSAVATAGGHSDAGPRIYAVHTAQNNCPEGLQPVTMDGVICCGKPNQSISYGQAKAHAVAKKRHVHRVAAARVDCPVGTKGCTFD